MVRTIKASDKSWSFYADTKKFDIAYLIFYLNYFLFTNILLF